MRKIVANKFLLIILGLVVVFSSCSAKDNSSKAREGTFKSVVWAKDFAPGQLEAHYLKHRHQFGDITEDEYLSRARILLNSAAGGDVLEKRRDNGDILRYRMSSGEFAVMTKEGRIRTYFKADYRYWQKQ